jgi:general secretion pathway protein L
MKSIGIDITKNGIAIVEVSADRNFYEIVSGDFIPLNPNDESNWELDLMQSLKEVTQRFDFKNSTIVVGLSQSSVSTRNVSFPFTRRLDIMKSLPFELDEELPLGIDDAVIDAKTISQNAAATSLLAFAAPKTDLEKWIELFEKLNIQPDIISVEGSAFANLYESWASGDFLASAPETIPAPVTVRLYFRYDSTLLTVFHDRHLIWARNISWGEKNIIFELMKTFNYPYEQAVEVLQTQLAMQVGPGQGAPEENLANDVLERSLAELIHTLNLSLIDIKDRFNTHVDSIYLLGTIGQIPNITAFLTRYIGVPINTESFSEDVFMPRQIQSVLAFVNQIPVAVGLALEGLKRPKNPPINFRQKEFAKNNQFWTEAWAKWGYAITLCAAAYVIYIFYGVAREEIALQLDTTTYEVLQKNATVIAGLKEREASPERIQKYLDDEKEKAKNAKVFEKVQDIEPAVKVVSALSTLLPSNKSNAYDIRRVDVKSNMVIIEGEAQKKFTVDLIRKKLEGLSADKRVQAIPPSILNPKGVAFAYKINVKETL